MPAHAGVRAEAGAAVADAPAWALTVVASVLFTDLVGSTALAARVGPAAADELQVELFRILRSGIEATSGREVKNLGDGLMFAFPGPVDGARRRDEDAAGTRPP